MFEQSSGRARELKKETAMVRTPGLCHPILMLKKAIALATTPTYSHLPFRILWQALFATTT